MVASALIAVTTTCGVDLAAARTAAVHPGFHDCQRSRLRVRGSAGGSLPITRLGVRRLSCMAAVAAIEAASYEATPGGPLISTAGYSCSGPVGPPPPNSRPRFYRCSRAGASLRFIVPGFS